MRAPWRAPHGHPTPGLHTHWHAGLQGCGEGSRPGSVLRSRAPLAGAALQRRGGGIVPSLSPSRFLLGSLLAAPSWWALGPGRHLHHGGQGVWRWVRRSTHHHWTLAPSCMLGVETMPLGGAPTTGDAHEDAVLTYRVQRPEGMTSPSSAASQGSSIWGGDCFPLQSLPGEQGLPSHRSVRGCGPSVELSVAAPWLSCGCHVVLSGSAPGPLCALAVSQGWCPLSCSRRMQFPDTLRSNSSVARAARATSVQRCRAEDSRGPAPSRLEPLLPQRLVPERPRGTGCRATLSLGHHQ